MAKRQRASRQVRKQADTSPSPSTEVSVTDDPEAVGSRLHGGIVYMRLVEAGIERAEADRLALAYTEMYGHLPLRRIERVQGSSGRVDSEALYG